VDPFLVHVPANPGDFFDKRVLKRRVPYRTLCGNFAKLPPRVAVKQDSDGKFWVVCGPHERYFAWCIDCERLHPETLYPVA
jgi:hypothetical protein